MHLTRSSLWDQELDDAHLVCPGSIVKGGLQIAVKVVHTVGVAFHQSVADVQITMTGCNVDRQHFVIVLHAGIGSRNKEDLHRLMVSTFNSEMHWSVKHVVSRLHQWSAIPSVVTHNFLDYLDVALLACGMEWNLLICILGQDVRTMI